MSIGIELCERGWIPDFVIRFAIRKMLRARLRKEDLGSQAANEARTKELVAEFSSNQIALLPQKANDQHYEVPAELFSLMLGRNRKYSCCFWNDDASTLDSAELEALKLSCERAEIKDGQDILELGCGWGSLTLYMAKRYPNSRIVGVSNSGSQREFILNQADELGLENVSVVTRDINDFEAGMQFDRVVSIEMFEHMRNHALLLQRIRSWLTQNGKLFVHIFCHRELTYKFEDESKSDWMSRHSFSGGIMPSKYLLDCFQNDLQVAKRWHWDGIHYQKTCEAWLKNLDKNREAALAILVEHYGTSAVQWFNRWRMFHLACSELFGYNFGQEWFVSHYLFEPAKS